MPFASVFFKNPSGETVSPVNIMRVEPYGIGSIIHIIKRGGRGMEIVRDEHDRARFIHSLYFLNEEYKSDYWENEIADLVPFSRPSHWPARKPLTDILAWTLLSNHLHLIIQIREDRETGVREFMQRLFRSMTGHFNEKYGERGSIFQGPYKSRTIDSDEYLRYVIPYVMVKNTFEMHPEGFEKAVSEFDRSWSWAAHNPNSSLATFLGETVSPITAESNIIHELFPRQSDFKKAARDMLEAYQEKRMDLRALQLED
jgi:hypothetical protein